MSKDKKTRAKANKKEKVLQRAKAKTKAKASPIMPSVTIASTHIHEIGGGNNLRGAILRILLVLALQIQLCATHVC